MKYYLLAGVICLMGAVSVMVSNQPEEQVASNKDWKLYAVENETKVRPASFEEMRYKLEETPELRAPASKKRN